MEEFIWTILTLLCFAFAFCIAGVVMCVSFDRRASEVINLVYALAVIGGFAVWAWMVLHP